MTSLWEGEVAVWRARYRCRGCGYSIQSYADPDLDESGLLPLTLERALEAGKLLPYRQSSDLLERWGVRLSKTRLARLDEHFNTVQAAQGLAYLQTLAEQPLARRQDRSRSWILEMDGKFVPVHTAQGRVYQEVKTAVLYKMRCPNERYYFSSLERVDAFSRGVHGLLRHAGLYQEDILVGVSDGAKWIEGLMGDLGVQQHILDVFHASTYLETVMQALGWEESQRDLTRQSLLRGQINVQSWLNLHLPVHSFPDDTARKAAQYLQQQSLLGHTNYPAFRARGLEVIGSGQIEGANKAVIGARLNVCGAHWTVSGANGMVFARAERASERPITHFHTIRHLAFSHAA
jgi:hypothetical protein